MFSSSVVAKHLDRPLSLLSQVHINLGAGETEFSSPKGLRLDDLSWHKVVISRKEAAFTLQIDVIHVVK
jgi:chondroitin sulfate proteoglycan 4